MKSSTYGAFLSAILFASLVHAESASISLQSARSLSQSLARVTKPDRASCNPAVCNPILNELVADDERGAFFGLWESSKPWKQCHYKELEKDVFPTAADLADYFAKDSNTRISVGVEDTIKACLPAYSSLSMARQKSVVTKFYSSLNQIGDALYNVTDEIYAIDQLTEKSSAPLKDIACDTGFDKVNARCTEHKGCPTQNNSFETFATNLKAQKANLESLEAAINKVRGQMAQFTAARVPTTSKIRKDYEEVLQQLLNAKKAILANNPILEGKKFKETLKSTNDFDAATKAQLTDNRAKLKEKMSALTKASECLRGNRADCRPEDVRDLLKEAPPPKLNASSGTARQAAHAENYLWQAMCLKERGEDRDATAKTIGTAAVDAALLGIPVVGAIARGAMIARTLNFARATRGASLSRVESSLQMMAAGVFTARSSTHAFTSCMSEDTVMRQIDSAQSMSPLSCPDPQLNIHLARATDTCIAAAGLAALDALSLGAAGKLALNTKDSLERIARAEQALGRKLSDKEKVALIEAHNTGTILKADSGYEYYSDADIARKARILNEAGFTRGANGEIRTLMSLRIAGDFSDMSQAYSKTVRGGIGEKVVFMADNLFSEGNILRCSNGVCLVKYKNKLGNWQIANVPIEKLRPPVKPGQVVGISRENGRYTSNGRVIFAFDNQAIVEVPGPKGTIGEKTVNIFDLGEPYKPGQQVWVRRSDGRYTKAIIANIDPETNELVVATGDYGRYDLARRSTYDEIRTTRPSAQEEAASVAEARARQNQKYEEQRRQEEARRQREAEERARAEAEERARQEAERMRAEALRRQREAEEARRRANPAAYSAYESLQAQTAGQISRLKMFQASLYNGYLPMEYAQEGQQILRSLRQHYHPDSFAKHFGGNIPKELREQLDAITADFNLMASEFKKAERTARARAAGQGASAAAD